MMSVRGLSNRFLAAMRFKLNVGYRKGNTGWDEHWNNGCSTTWLLGRMQAETNELLLAISKGDPNEILSECADVANFAMFIADKTKP